MDNLSGAPVAVRVDFLAKGMLCNVISAMGSDSGDDPQWQPILDVLRDDAAEAAADAADLDAAAAAEKCSPGSPAEPDYAAYVEKAFTT
jgi:TorA maturation chaperone TorD